MKWKMANGDACIQFTLTVLNLHNSSFRLKTTFRETLSLFTSMLCVSIFLLFAHMEHSHRLLCCVFLHQFLYSPREQKGLRLAVIILSVI